MSEVRGYKLTPIDGDVEIGRNAAVGGNASVAGTLHVHGLEIAGFMESRYSKGAVVGVFSTEDILRAAYSVPKEGWLAAVGSGSPFRGFVGRNGVWQELPDPVNITAWNYDWDAFMRNVERRLNEMSGKIAKSRQPLVHFNGFTENYGGNIFSGGTEMSASDVVYNRTFQRFLSCRGLVAAPGDMYTTWSNSDIWGENCADGVKPYEGVLYVDDGSGTLYFYDGSVLRDIAGGGGSGLSTPTIYLRADGTPMNVNVDTDEEWEIS